MEPSELLRYATGVLESMQLRYFVTGSTATIFYGEARFTNDIDIVVDLPETRLAEFCRRFPEEQFYVSIDAARDSLRRKSQFNIIHPASGLKIDVIIPEANSFNESRFARVQRVHAGEKLEACFASPEDAMIKKMEYYQRGESEKHLRDITGILKVSGEQIDRAYIAKWAKRLGLESIWAAVCKRAGSAD